MSDEHETALVTVPRAEVRGMHPLVQAAMAQSPDPATLRELLAVQRDWEAGEARKAYTRAMVALKRDLPTVLAKDATVDFTSKTGQRTHYRHTSLAAMMDVITEPLTAHGFSLSWEPSTGERNLVRVTGILTHAEGHSASAALEAPADVSGSKNPAQAIASTITLLSRYVALALLGIATADHRDPVPAREVRPDGVDQTKNLRAAAWLRKQGVPPEQAEAHVGRPVAAWRAADLVALKALAQGIVLAPGEDPSDREPGEAILNDSAVNSGRG